MRLWLVRAGRHGEHEELNFSEGIAAIGFVPVPDLSGCSSREDVLARCRQSYPSESDATVLNFAGQLWAFVGRMEEGDLVVLPLKTVSGIAVGKVAGPYVCRTDLPDGLHHTRKVKWLRTDIPRNSFNQDLLYSMGAFLTVCEISRHNALARVQAVLAGSPDPGWVEEEPVSGGSDGSDVPVQPDLERMARDQINARIQGRFTGHDLARLVDEVLKAQGYLTRLSPPGPDGGVDILAGGGSLGFDAPRLCVQVKSSTSPCDVTVLRALVGTMQTFSADQGLLVSWGGFKSSVVKEAASSFFKVRLWDADDLLEAILKAYDRLPDDLQAELPLKRVWILVPGDAAEGA